MVNGNILLDEDGLNIQNIEDSKKRTAVGNFCEMIEEANAEGDTLHYMYDSPCNIYSILYDPENPHCKLIGQRLFSQLQTLFGNFPHAIHELKDFETKNEPRTHGGYKYENSPSSDYVYDKESINSWHDEWYNEHPETLDWNKFDNAIWPRYDRTIDVLKQEILKAGKDVPSNDEDIANLFHHEVMKLLDERARISKSRIIGDAICKANYYHREEELERLEVGYGNIHADRIYAIKKNGKYQFLSIDIQHGMFELCNDKGDHLGEFRFDGTPNGNNTIEVDHGLRCINEWKHNNRK